MTVTTTYRLAVVAGDGIGPEVVAEGLKCLTAVTEGTGIAFETTEFELGAKRWHATGETLTDADLAAIRSHDVILLGAIGDPSVPSGVLERGVLLPLRFALDQYVNLRPSRLYPGEVSPLRDVTEVDFVVVREGTEGPYVGNGGALRVDTPHEIATEVSINTRHGVERVVRYAFAVAAGRERKQLTLGSKVTVVEGLPHLVPNEDEALSKGLERAFRKRGIDFKVGVKFQGVTQSDAGVTVTLEDGTTLDADVLLVAVGRGPRSAGLGYEEQGIRVDRGFVLTDERLHTGIANIYAVGDIVPGLQLAHRGFQQGIFVAEQIAGLNPQPIVESNIPRVTYCEPEVASVGVTEAKAKEIYGDDAVVALEYNLGGNGKSQILGTAGFVKLVRVKDGPVVGVHMLGSRVGEQIGEAQLIVSWEAHPEDVAPLIHAHPTQNEALGEAHQALAGKPLHAHD